MPSGTSNSQLTPLYNGTDSVPLLKSSDPSCATVTVRPLPDAGP